MELSLEAIAVRGRRRYLKGRFFSPFASLPAGKILYIDTRCG
jgi:hypothetical protein